MRLLSFLNDIEHALNADEPSPQGGVWESTRTINYLQGVARLSLGTRNSAGTVKPLGTVTLQAFELADGTSCLKSYLSWSGSQSESIHAIYAKPDLNWAGEARRVAAGWLNGRTQAESKSTSRSESLAVAS
jgi:hypothetical protein